MAYNTISKQDTATHDSLISAQTFITVSHTEVLTDIKNMPDESTNLGNILSDADVALKLRSKTPDVTPADIKGYKKSMSVNTFALVKEARSLCKQTKNSEMLNALKFPASHIIKADKIVAVTRANDIYDLIHGKKDIFTNIDDSEYLKARTSITTFDTNKDVPIMTRKNKKDYGTLMYKKALKDGRASVLNMLEMLEAKYSVTNPELVTAFRSVIAIIILGVRHNPVNTLFTDADTGLPIQNLKMVRTSKKGKETVFVSNSKGIVAQKTHKLGETSYIAKADGYPDTPFTVKPTKGVLTKIFIILKKII